MAFDYDTTNTGVFFRLGKIIKKINAYAALAATTYPADLKEIADPYELADMTLQIDSLYAAVQGWQVGVGAIRRQLGDYASRTLTDRVTVANQLGLATTQLRSILPALVQKMVDDTETVDKSTVTVGTVTAAGSNLGNGTVLVTKVLDGFNAPVTGGTISPRYAGVDSEMAVASETMTIVCTSDSQTSGGEAGSESWSCTGGPKYDPFSYEGEGSGTGPGLKTSNGGFTLVTDGGFEAWTNTNTPSFWTIANGTAGTHIFRESTNIHLGTYSLKFLGTGAQATIGVYQAVANLKPRRRYCLSLRIKASGTPAAGQINVIMTGTGYTAGGTEKIQIAAGSFPTAAFTAAGSLQHFFFNAPASIPSDFALSISIGSTLSNGTAVYFDSVALAEVVYHGGVGMAIVQGTTAFAIGDKFTFTLANDEAGVFQSFFRRWFKCQLPSDASPSIADSLAT